MEIKSGVACPFGSVASAEAVLDAYNIRDKYPTAEVVWDGYFLDIALGAYIVVFAQPYEPPPTNLSYMLDDNGTKIEVGASTMEEYEAEVNLRTTEEWQAIREWLDEDKDYDRRLMFKGQLARRASLVLDGFDPAMSEPEYVIIALTTGKVMSLYNDIVRDEEAFASLPLWDDLPNEARAKLVASVQNAFCGDSHIADALNDTLAEQIREALGARNFIQMLR